MVVVEVIKVAGGGGRILGQPLQEQVVQRVGEGRGGGLSKDRGRSEPLLVLCDQHHLGRTLEPERRMFDLSKGDYLRPGSGGGVVGGGGGGSARKSAFLEKDRLNLSPATRLSSFLRQTRCRSVVWGFSVGSVDGGGEWVIKEAKRVSLVSWRDEWRVSPWIWWMRQDKCVRGVNEVNEVRGRVGEESDVKWVDGE